MDTLILLLCLVALPGLTIAYAVRSGYFGYVLVRAMAYGCRSTTLPCAPVPQGVGSVKTNQVAPSQV
jgi:hypothetical protein